MGRVQETLQLRHLSREGFLRLIDHITDTLELRHIFFGRPSPSPGHGQLEMHPAFVFDVPLSGGKQLAWGGPAGVCERHLTPGEVLFCEPLAWKLPGWESPHELCCFVFREEFIRVTYVDIPEALPPGIRPVCSCFVHSQLPPTESIRRILHCLTELGRNGDPGNAAPDLVRGLFRLTRSRLAEDGSPQTGKAERNYERIRQNLQENFRSPLSREGVAEEFRLHPGYLSRLFTTRGESFSAVLRDLRLEHAALLLRNTELLVDEIADQCGYQSTTFFTTVFRSRYGMPPGRYRCLHSAPARREGGTS